MGGVPQKMMRRCVKGAAAENLGTPVKFVATSNKTALTVQKVQGEPQLLEDVLKGNRTFEAAFEPEGDEDDLAGVLRLSGERDASSNQEATIIQCSKREATDACFRAPRGIVSALVDAYNSHHELVLRPDDIWQAVLTQLSFYVQARSEDLRDKFVNFEGKKQLEIKSAGTLFSADFGQMALQMVEEQIAQNLKDAAMAEWLIPCFSTTTPNDRVAASVSTMATLKAYFDYKFSLCCGIPAVTLLGSSLDWRELRAKIDRLPEFDLEDKLMSKWQGMLTPVLDQFIESSEGWADVKFWDKVCCHMGGGSGPSYLSGWVTTFCVFTAEGDWQGDRRDVPHSRKMSEWPIVDTNDLPVASVMVPVLVDDNGTEYQTKMFAGQFAYDVMCDATTIQPRSDWCIAVESASLPKAVAK